MRMYASDWPSQVASGVPRAPSRQRAEGVVRLSAARMGNATRVADLAERGSARLRLPRAPGPALEAVLINTGGGVTGGDVFATSISVLEGAELAVITAAAEKLYRSDGSTASITVDLHVRENARLDWMPQETIVFDRSRLRRRLDAEVAPGGRLLVFEALVFGRAAHAETVTSAMIEDRWRIRRGGRLVYADTLRLDGDVSALLRKPAVAAGARALATILYVADEAEARLDAVRETLARSGTESGASAWNGLLAIRILAQDIGVLRDCAQRAITLLRGSPMPRVWLT